VGISLHAFHLPLLLRRIGGALQGGRWAAHEARRSCRVPTMPPVHESAPVPLSDEGYLESSDDDSRVDGGSARTVKKEEKGRCWGGNGVVVVFKTRSGGRGRTLTTIGRHNREVPHAKSSQKLSKAFSVFLYILLSSFFFFSDFRFPPPRPREHFPCTHASPPAPGAGPPYKNSRAVCIYEQRHKT